MRRRPSYVTRREFYVQPVLWWLGALRWWRCRECRMPVRARRSSRRSAHKFDCSRGRWQR